MRFRRLLSKLPAIDLPLSNGERMDRMLKTQEKIIADNARMEGMMTHYENRLDTISTQVGEIKKQQERPRPPEGLMEAINRPTEKPSVPSLFPNKIVRKTRDARQRVRHGHGGRQPRERSFTQCFAE